MEPDPDPDPEAWAGGVVAVRIGDMKEVGYGLDGVRVRRRGGCQREVLALTQRENLRKETARLP